MRKYFVITGIGLFMILTASICLDSGEFLATLRAKLQSFGTNYPDEKVYLHVDKTFYRPGEDIWFSVYLLDGTSYQPSGTSDVVYVDLIDPRGNVVSQFDMYMQKGRGKGDFHLDGETPGGIYKLSAYTRWMKNFGNETFFTKEIQVQKIVTPRLLLKLDFKKEAYGKGDAVLATLTVNDLRNEPVTNHAVDYTVKLDGKEFLQAQAKTDEKGQALITFDLPQQLNTPDGLLNVMVDVKGTSESISRSIPIQLNRIDLQFFPEGGYMVEQVPGRVAFKALNEFGKAADVSGIVVDNNGTVVSQFESFHMGMGVVDLTPERDKKYFARIIKPEGTDKIFELPKPLSSGFTMRVENKGEESVRLSIHAPVTTNGYLVGRSGNEIRYAEEKKFKAGSNEFFLPVNLFPAGITAFTVFDQNGTGQCERLVFLNRHKDLRVSVSTDKQHYMPREKVSVTIKTTDSSGLPQPATLSLAVVDDQLITMADDKQDNILSWFLMSSEIRGEVQEPNFYFKTDEPKANEALDYLLMTQGWRRFSWNDVLHEEPSLTYTAEKAGNISGQVVNRKNRDSRRTELTLLELGNKKRLVQLKTTSDGRFHFYNVDPTTPVLLLSKAPLVHAYNWEIVPEQNGAMLRDNKVNGVTSVFDKFKNAVPASIKEEVNVIADQGALEAGTQGGEINVALEEDVKTLSECVVIGYGTASKADIAGAMTTIRRQGGGVIESVQEALQGRVSGVMVTPQSGSPGETANIRIRGISSFSTSREPLYVVDGVPVGTGLNANFSSVGLISPQDIESIEVLSSPEATAGFGSAAVGGVILINTKRKTTTEYDPDNGTLKFIHKIIKPRVFSVAREFYVPDPIVKKENKRDDLRTTVYWNPLVTTDRNGEANVSFYNTDATSAFRITAEGVSGAGAIGRKEEMFYTELPISLDAKFPEYLTFEDTLNLSLQVKNTGSASITGQINIQMPPELKLLKPVPVEAVVEAGETATISMPLITQSIKGKFPVKVMWTGSGYEDTIEKEIEVLPIGFATSVSFSSRELDKTISFNIEDMEKGSLRAELVAYPDILSDLTAGMSSMLREPHGCFEQVSSSTYPNILVLQLLKETRTVNPDTEKRALEFIRNGYKKLAAYETSEGGFEWFGHTPSHEGLTAYGLMEFEEMKKVYNGVSESMVRRTRDWLLSRRTGDGTFKQNPGKYDWFSRSTKDVTNAYLVFSLTETGVLSLDKEYEHALQNALSKKDSYCLALMANAAFSLKRMDEYETLMEYFRTEMKEKGLGNLRAETSITQSGGKSLQVETASLWAIAMMKRSAAIDGDLNTIVNYIIQQRSYGGFGSTQATILALKTLMGYARLARNVQDDGTIKLFVNRREADNIAYNVSTKEELRTSHWAKYLTNGTQHVRVMFNDTREALPYSVNVSWSTKTPATDPGCKVKLAVSMKEKMIGRNQTVRLTATLKNKTTDGLPMTVALIGIPAGLSLQPWQLKELQEKRVFDYYEIIGQYLVLYYTSFGPSETYVVNLDLKADIAGTYLSPASTAYLYYTSEHKDWVAGNRVEVR